MERIIVYAFPVFGLLIFAEYAWGIARGRNTYRLNDAISNLTQGVLSQITLVFTGIFQIGIYTLFYKALGFHGAERFWDSWYGWIIAMILVDFCGYWLHRYSHETGILWAAHAVHHQSQDFNFSTALRQESAYPVLGWIFYLPLAFLGLPPDTFAVTGLVVLLYQIWIHTEHVGKLGWVDRVFSTPSNHRVHHAINDHYIDKNYGGMLIIWDRMFGTFAEETEEKCVYGTKPPLDTWDPVWANLAVYWNLFRDASRSSSLKDRLKIWFMPPGWRPADVEEKYPKPAFDIAKVVTYDPVVGRGNLWFASVQFLVLLAAAGALLWNMDDLSFAASAMFVFAMLVAYWGMGRVLDGRGSVFSALMLDAAALGLAATVL